MNLNYTSRSEDEVLTQCVHFGGAAQKAAEIARHLDSQLLEANNKLVELREEIKLLQRERERSGV